MTNKESFVMAGVASGTQCILGHLKTLSGSELTPTTERNEEKRRQKNSDLLQKPVSYAHTKRDPTTISLQHRGGQNARS
jgi:hypothetical protein